ncbi:MAG: DUF1592 domain-containing protein [Pirellulaceae bacterium]|nr:DUF1592 domain-containing protein [Pirellulaceae bacterium]
MVQALLNKSYRVKVACAWLTFVLGVFVPKANAIETPVKSQWQPFLAKYCFDCHSDTTSEGGLNIEQLGADFNDVILFDRWLRLFDRVDEKKMPPSDTLQPTNEVRAAFLKALRIPLWDAHSRSKETVRRRLNRSEYSYAVNDLFGTDLDLAARLPEDGRSHEFDNVAETLSVSMVQIERYMEAIDAVLDSAIATSSQAPAIQLIRTSYAETREGDQFIGTKWLKLDDSAVVFFQDFGYPTGMLRSAHADQTGNYKIRVTGYAYQTDQPITFSIGATSFGRGEEKPTFGYFSMPPGKPTTIEIEAKLEQRQMIDISPWGIFDKEYAIKNLGVENYRGPGLAILSVELEGPLYREFPLRGHRLVFDGLEIREAAKKKPNDKQKIPSSDRWEVIASKPRIDGSKVIRRIAEAAFRRPVESSELAPYEKLFADELSVGSSFGQALRSAIIAIFTSPDFLFLTERTGKLDDYALASRLSYFLTRTSPDEQLLAAAKKGLLSNGTAGLLEQSDRLLVDPRFDRFIRDFADAWLNLRDINFTNPDQMLFPEFDSYLRSSMIDETRAFLKELIDRNLGIRNLIRSDFAMLNERVAQHYGIESVDGPEIRRVQLPDNSVRGGLLSHASILKVSANGTNTSPVVRGVWVSERILGKKLDPPPPGVPGIEPDIRGTTTLRGMLEVHRNNNDCQACHAVIDPPGFALESFDPIGGWRDRFRSLGEGESVKREIQGRKVRFKLGLPVDSSGEFEDGRKFNDFNEFRKLLLEDEAELARAFLTKLLTFSTGREMGFSDRDEIETIVMEFASQGYPIRDLIKRVIASEIFRNK